MPRSLPETPAHRPAREALLDRCFGPARHRKTCELLRRDRNPASGLAFSLLEGESLIGTLRLWHVTAGSAGPALLLGPVAVTPERQSQGLGALLMRHGLAEAERLGHGAILLVGDAPYYTRFGFSRSLTEGLAMPGPVELERFLGLELLSGSLTGARGIVSASGPVESQPDVAAIAALHSSFPMERHSNPTHASAR
ncbi:MAG: N-acetyltransferase [Proteobacteria bacterium]|nr:N-acetyltransferase [Pseudomonadota bacterium]